MPIVHISTAPSQHFPTAPHLFHMPDVGANQRLDTLFKLWKAGYQAEIVCRCGPRAMLDVRHLIDECQRVRIGLNSFAPLANRMKCSQCGGRPQRIGPVKR